MKHKSLKLARKFIESQGGFVTTKTPAELGYANCPVCGTYQEHRFTHCLKCGGEMVMPPNTACSGQGLCPECDSKVLPSQYCMMGHWCGERPAAKA